MEEATRIGSRSGKFTEEQRKEVEEEVIRIFQKCFSTSTKVASYAKSVKGKEGRQYIWSMNKKTISGARARSSADTGSDWNNKK